MRRAFLVIAFAMAVGLTAYAQSVPAGGASASSGQRADAPVTVEGCLMKEVDVPNRRPPETARAQAEADDDYVLTNTKVITGTAPSVPSSSSGGGAAGTTGTTPSGLMYDIEGIAKDQLKLHVGKRVQIDGAFDHLENAKLPVSFATDLVEIKGTTLRSVPGACPGK